MEEYIADWVTGIFIWFQQSVSSTSHLLAQDLTTNTNMWTMVGTVQGVVKPISYLISIVFFLIEFIKITFKMDMLKWEHLFNMLAKFVFAKACIDFGATLMDIIYSTVAEWISTFGATTYDASIFAGIIDGITAELSTLPFWGMMGFAVTSILPCVIIMICGLVVYVIAYGRMIEIYILLAFMPIPFAFILESEGHSNLTKKYIMNFAGVCLQGFMMVVASSFYQYLMADIIANMATDGDCLKMLLSMVLGAVTLVLVIAKSGQWSKQIFNAM